MFRARRQSLRFDRCVECSTPDGRIMMVLNVLNEIRTLLIFDQKHMFLCHGGQRHEMTDSSVDMHNSHLSVTHFRLRQLL